MLYCLFYFCLLFVLFFVHSHCDNSAQLWVSLLESRSCDCCLRAMKRLKVMRRTGTVKPERESHVLCARFCSLSLDVADRWLPSAQTRLWVVGLVRHRHNSNTNCPHKCFCRTARASLRFETSFGVLGSEFAEIFNKAHEAGAAFHSIAQHIIHHYIMFVPCRTELPIFQMSSFGWLDRRSFELWKLDNGFNRCFCKKT